MVKRRAYVKGAGGKANDMTADVDMLTEATSLLEQGMRLALCTIIEKQGSGPRDIGTKMIVREDGITYGTIGGGTLE
ncbi:MAG: XdhC family protein, partial [Halobacteriota archaeon]